MAASEAVEKAASLVVTLFGPFAVRLHGAPLPHLRSRKAQWLLALLALREGHEVDRSWLATTLWPDSRESDAYYNLRRELASLRRALGPEADRLRSPSVRTLCLDLTGAAVDVVSFDAALRQGNPPALERAVTLYRGPLLEGCAEEWAFAERQIREQAFLAALESLAGQAQQRGDLGAAERCLRRAVAVDPLRESAQRALMQALGASGNFAAASEVYRELRLRLHRELNAAPDAETQALYQHLRAQAQGKTAHGSELSALGSGKDSFVREPCTVSPDPSFPVGTVTFLFTDIEGSSQLWERHPEAMRAALEQHDLLLRHALQAHGGIVFKTVGDAFYAAFATAPATLAAALAAQEALLGEDWGEIGPLRVRMALHTGIAEAREGDYFGATLNRVARLLDAAHGGQVLLSLPTEQLVRDTLPEGAGLRPLGEHRLKDLVRPEQIFQLLHPDLPAAFPPLRSLEAFAHNLPVQLTSFVGREREIAEIERLLAGTHLLTLTGAGGCGKTRLTLQIAADLVAEYGDGVWLVELAALTDPALLPQTVAAALGVREEPNRPLAATLADHLRARALLLVMDNCEHLLAACAGLAEALLRSCPRLRILATSREGLQIAGETSYRVPPLSLPAVGAGRQALGVGEGGPNAERLTPSAVLQSEAACLFVERAMAALPSFVLTDRNTAAVAQLCHRLDGIPLAIELAAARVKALPVEKLAERLDDRFRLLTGGSRTALPRQQTLRALIDWSYDLLTEPEQALLCRLSVFAGGWSLEAAEAVGAGHDAEEWEVLDLLTALVDKSLVQYEERGQEPRYRLLETVRQYARERLEEQGEATSVRGRHRDWFLALAERAAPELHRWDQRAWLERLETEHDNLRAALEWCASEENGAEASLRLAGALWSFWHIRGYWAEGRQWLEEALSRGANAPPALRARALAAMAILTGLAGDYASRRPLAEEGLRLARAAPDPWIEAHLLVVQGGAAREERDLIAAAALGEQSLALAREVGDPLLLAEPLLLLGMVAWEEGDCERAAPLLTESLSLLRQMSDRMHMPIRLLNLGVVAMLRGDFAEAVAHCREGVVLSREFGDKRGIIWCLQGLAAVAAAQGESVRAARMIGAVDATLAAIGHSMPPRMRAMVERTIATARAAIDESTYTTAWAEGRAMSLEQAIRVALEVETGG